MPTPIRSALVNACRASTLLIALSLTACSSEDSDTPAPGPDMTVADMTADATPDAQTDDMSDDMPAGDDMAADMSEDMADMPPAVCAFPSARIGQGDAAALAASPARCGMPDYKWITQDFKTSPTVIAGTGSTYRAQQLKVLVAAAGVALPREPDYDVKVEVIRYDTQDRGVKIGTSAVIAAPTSPTTGPLDILLVLHGTSGFNDDCAPSKGSETKLLAAALASLGYIVVAPDYIGMTYDGDTGFVHPYLVAEPTAFASIDAARAAGELVAAGEFGETCAAPRVAIVGGSQGGHAALWVDRLLPYYGQELTLVGTVATVPPADLVGQMERALKAPVEATANVIAFLAAAAPWYGVTDRLSEVFVAPYDTTVLAALQSSCDPTDELPLGSNLEDVFTTALLTEAQRDQLAMMQPWGCMARENGLTTTSIARQNDSTNYGPGYGILYVLGEEDKLVDTATERVSFGTLCEEQSMPLEFLECAGASHTRATAWALPDILTYLDARAAGTPPDATRACMLAAPTRCSGTPR